MAVAHFKTENVDTPHNNFKSLGDGVSDMHDNRDGCHWGDIGKAGVFT